MSTPTKSLRKHLKSGITAVLKKTSFNSQTTAKVRSPPIPKLPQELVDIIASFLIYDTGTLIACSMTSFVWYKTVVPHLHYTLTTDDEAVSIDNQWPKRLEISHNKPLHELLPHVGKICIRKPTLEFTPELLSKPTSSYFSAFRNVQELEIDRLQISKFMPWIEGYFENFTQTLRSLALSYPGGSSRQILYFVGLFPHLQDLKLCNLLCVQERGAADSTPKPAHRLPLRGRLTLSFVKEPFLKDMIKLLGGLRFRYMELFTVHNGTLLLEACAETLETLRLYPADTHVKDLNLSKNRSLRTLETTSRLLTATPAAPGHLLAAFATTKPHGDLPLDVVIIHDEFEARDDSPDSEMMWRSGVKDASASALHIVKSPKFSLQNSERFKVYHEMYSERKFRLVLCADVVENIKEQAKEVLRGESQGPNGWPYELLVTTKRRRPPPINPGRLPVRPTAIWSSLAAAL